MKKRILAYGRLNENQLAQLAREFEVQTFSDLTPSTTPASVPRSPGHTA
jgi:phosphogluconate 2-dehydrogenase